MKKMKAFFDLFPMMLLWLVLSVILWGFVFNHLTDAEPENKIMLFIDAPLTEETRLALQLEERMEAPVEMVQVRPFSYAMMGGDAIENADLYIVGASQAETYKEWFAPLPQTLQAFDGVMEIDGMPMGIKVYDAAAQQGVGTSFILYGDPSKAAEDYYLFLGAHSLHVQSHEQAVDDQAVSCVFYLLELP